MVGCLSNMQEPSASAWTKTRTQGHAPVIPELRASEAGGSKVQGHLQPQSESDDSLEGDLVSGRKEGLVYPWK